MKQFWGWELATYLYLGGLGGGMLCFAAIIGLFLEPSAIGTGSLVWPVLWSIIIICVGVALLVFELGQRIVFERAFVTKTSVIKWGAVVLVLSCVFAALYLIWEITWFNFLPCIPFEGFAKFCLGAAGFFGICVMVYTGTMLSSLKAKAFWNTPALPMLFTISALSTGACADALLFGHFPLPAEWLQAGALYGSAEWSIIQHEVVEFLHIADLVLAIAEIICLLLYVLLMFCAPSSVDAKKVANKWVRGSWAPIFWGLMLGLGLVVPVLCNIHGLSMGGSALGNYVAPVLVLLSGLLFRFMIIYSADRKLYAGEEKYYTVLSETDAHEDYMDYWKGGAQYFNIVNAADFDDMNVIEGRTKTALGTKLKWALTNPATHDGVPEPNPAYPRYRKNIKSGKVFAVFTDQAEPHGPRAAVPAVEAQPETAAAEA